MADEVEVVDLAQLGILLTHGFEQHVLLLEFVEDELLAVGLCPGTHKGIERGIDVADGLAREVGEAFGGERLAVGTEMQDVFVHDADVASVDTIFLSLFVILFSINIVAVPDDRSFVLVATMAIRGGSVGFAIEFGILEEAGDIAEVEYLETQLALLFKDARAAAHHLLERRHTVDLLVDDDEAARLAIDARLEQHRRGGDDGSGRIDILEVFEQLLAHAVVAGDAHHVVGIFPAELGIHLDEQFAHLERIFGFGTEDDGLGHGTDDLEHLGDASGDDDFALGDAQGAADVAAHKEVLLDPLTFEIDFIRLGNIAFEIDREERARDAIGRQEAVLDALLEAIDIDGRPEVVDVGGAFGILGRGSHTDLNGFAEIVENLLPFGVLLDRRAMTLVDDDEVEEVGTEVLVGLTCTLFVVDPLAIERHIDFVASVGILALHLGHGLVEGLEVVEHRLVDEHIAVGKIEHLAHTACTTQTIDNLEGGVGLSRTGSHDEEDALLSACHGFDGAVDGLALIVARAFLRDGVEIVGHVDDGLLLG